MERDRHVARPPVVFHPLDQQLHDPRLFPQAELFPDRVERGQRLRQVAFVDQFPWSVPTSA
jgi:hypothetical protein